MTTWVDEWKSLHHTPPCPEDEHGKKLRAEHAMLRRMILDEKGKSGLESIKSVDRLIAAIQTEGFTVD